MTLTLYGSPRSRTMRVLWMLAELELAYNHVPLGWDDPRLKSPEFLALNPAGAIPTLVDDGAAISESLAINLYLAKAYGVGRGLYPADVKGEAQIWRWTLWAQGHLEPWVQQDALLADLRAAAGDQGRKAAARALVVLDRALAATDWLTGTAFSVADLNVAGVLSPSRASRLDLSPYQNIRSFLERCYLRPAAVETRRRFG